MTGAFSKTTVAQTTILSWAATLLAVASISWGGTVTENAAAPSVRSGSADILQTLSGAAQYGQNGINYYADNGVGQTFTTGASASGYTLDKIGVNVADAGYGVSSATLSIYPVYIAGDGYYHADLSHVLATETDAVPALVSGDWLTFTLTAPVTLSAHTQYAYLISTSSSWFGAGITLSDVQPGGFAFDGAYLPPHSNDGFLDNQAGYDAAFYAGLEPIAIVSAVPEPASLGMLTLVGTALMLRLSKRHSR